MPITRLSLILRRHTWHPNTPACPDKLFPTRTWVVSITPHSRKFCLPCKAVTILANYTWLQVQVLI